MSLESKFQGEYAEYFEILRMNDAPTGINLPDLKYFKKKLSHFTTTVQQDEISTTIREGVPCDDIAILKRDKLRYIDGMVERWLDLKQIYDAIDISVQTEETGREIIIKTKQLIEQFHPLFMELVMRAKENPENPIKVPNQLYDLRERIVQNILRYGELPAVQWYDGTDKDMPKGMKRYEWLKAGKPRPKKEL